MTKRAFILGLLGGTLIAGFGYLNDSVFRLNYIVGNHVPISVFGLLIVFALGVNPLLRRFGRGVAFLPSEIAVVVALTLVGCTIPGSGLMRDFTQIMVMPAHENRVRPEWQENRMLDYAPPQMLVNKGIYDEHVTGSYLYGADHAEGRRLLDFGNIPWQAWATPLAVWVPMIFLSGVAVICMSLIVHGQWSRNELLPYPIATFAHAIIAGGKEHGRPPLLRSKGFLIGMGLIFALRLFNGLYLYYPDYFVSIPMRFDLRPFADLCEPIKRAPGWHALLLPTIYPAVIGFAFFLSSEISLSIGLAQVIVVPILAILASFGVSVAVWQLDVGLLTWQMFGSHLAMALMILYMGRHAYWRILRQGVTFRGPHTDGHRYAVLAFRVFILAFAALVIVLVWLGLAWPLAVLMVTLMLMMYLTTARISAECGLPHVETNWNAMAVFLGMFGIAALGPRAIVITGLLCAMFMVTVRESLMPFIVNGLKICEDAGVRPSRIGHSMGLVLATGLAVAIPVVLAVVHTTGSSMDWWAGAVARLPFERGLEAVYRLRATGELDTSLGLSALQRLSHISPQPGFLLATGIGAVLVLLFSFLRLRFAWWPLHPVIFLVWCTWPVVGFGHSFLLAWIIKTALMRFGGSALCDKARPAMIGIIAGDLLAGLLFMVVGAVYYIVTGTPGRMFFIFLG